MKKIIKNRSLGLMNTSDYTCKYDWPTECFVQCGGKGVVMGNQHRKGYVTAFFEAFPFNNFIRGEGETIDLAEDAAWKKYQVMANCTEHSFKKSESRQRDAVCECCGLSIRDYYPPEKECSCCGKSNVSLSIYNQYFCLEHFIEKAEQLNYQITAELISGFKKEVFEDIQASQEKEKNIIDLMLGKNDGNLSSYEDISNDDYRVEMKISNLKDIEFMKNILKATKMANISDKFSSEYEMIDWIQKQKDSLSMVSVKKTTEFFNLIIDNLRKNNAISPDFKSFKYFNDTEAKFDEIESQVKLSLFIDILVREYNIDEDMLYRPLFGISKIQKLEMIQNNIIVSVCTFDIDNQ